MSDAGLMKKFGLTTSQFSEYKQAFCMFDENGDGTIEASELAKVMRKLNLPISKADVDAMVNEVDTDGNGEIDFEEFLNLMTSHSGDLDDDLREAFRVFDKDGNGFIDIDELKQAIKLLSGKEPSTAEVSAMMTKADKNSDGKVSFEEFKIMMAS